jgi:hypothetical protein
VLAGVLLRPFLFGKGLVANSVVSIDVFGAINPQPSKLGYRRETGHGRTVLPPCLFLKKGGVVCGGHTRNVRACRDFRLRPPQVGVDRDQ